MDKEFTEFDETAEDGFDLDAELEADYAGLDAFVEEMNSMGQGAESDSVQGEPPEPDAETEPEPPESDRNDNAEHADSGEETASEEELTEEQLEELLQKERKKEIRHILLGNFVVFEDGSYGAGGGSWVTPFGFSDGALRMLNFGISVRKILYTSTVKNNTKILYEVLKSMKSIGRRLILATAPEYPSCLIKSLIFRPVVLLFETVSDDKNNTEFVLRAYCSRGIFSFLSIMRAVSRFNKALPREVYNTKQGQRAAEKESSGKKKFSAEKETSSGKKASAKKRSSAGKDASAGSESSPKKKSSAKKEASAENAGTRKR